MILHKFMPGEGATAPTSRTSAGGRPHAVVIGSGFGGLAAAIRLGARGYRVTVLERLDAPGGRAYVYRQDGFTFDAGPTIVTAPFLLEQLWDLCGKKLSDDVDLRPMSPFYRIHFHDGFTFDTSQDAAAMRAQIMALSPGDLRGYERFMAYSEEVLQAGFERLGHVPFGSWTDMARAIPALARLGSHRTVYDVVSRYVRDPRLRVILSFHPLLIGGNPFSTTAVYTLIAALEQRWGVHFAMGGTGRIVAGLASLIEGQGNRIRCGETVTSITVAKGRTSGVRLESGEEIAADVVVSNADSAWTYLKLLPEQYRNRWTDRKIARARFSNGLFVWYFGTRRRYENVPHHTILLGPRYKELLSDIFDRQVLAQDFSLYLHRPTATDPSLAPQGCDTFYVLSPVPNLGAQVDWKEAALPYRKMIERYLGDTLLPDLGRNIATSRMLTPHDFRERLLSVQGAGFGLEPVLTQSAWFRPHNRSEEVEGLYLVGAGTHPGAGLPGVLSSARIVDSLVPDAATFS